MGSIVAAIEGGSSVVAGKAAIYRMAIVAVEDW